MKTEATRRRRLPMVLLIIALKCGLAAAQFGELPPGSVSKTEQGLTSELVLLMAFDPATVKDQLPEGLRFRTLEEYAGRDAAMAEYLRAHPEQRGWARGYFEIIHADSYLVDGRPARFGKRGGMAVWYAYVARTHTSDERPRGGNLLALGSWISDRKLARYMRQKGFPVNLADIKYWQDSKGIHGRMKATGFDLSATCRLRGEPEKVKLPTPAYLTVWTPRTIAQTFELLTGYGNTNQGCTGVEWQAQGKHPFVSAFLSRAQGGDELSGAEYEFGYVLQTALYGQK